MVTFVGLGGDGAGADGGKGVRYEGPGISSKLGTPCEFPAPAGGVGDLPLRGSLCSRGKVGGRPAGGKVWVSSDQIGCEKSGQLCAGGSVPSVS